MFRKCRKMIFCTLTLVAWIINAVASQGTSPCPETFSYEPNTELDRWYGVISLRTAEDLNGVWLDVILDRPAELLGNWFGEASSSDNIEYTVRNKKYKLEAGPPVQVRFFVKYNTAHSPPTVKTIRLNGKTICSTKLDEESLRPTMPTLHISQQVKPTSSPSSHGRPNESNGSSRPSGPSRPSSRPSNSRPSSSSSRPGNPSGSNFNRNPDDYNIGSISRPSPSSRPSSRPSSSGHDSGERTDGVSSLSGQNQNYNNNDYNERETSYNNQRPSGADNSNTNYNREPQRPQSGDFANLGPSTRPSMNSQNTVEVRKPGCGTVAARASPLINHGQNTTPGQWPWHAALYHSKGIQLMYTCGGTLISDQHILTAAHCVTKPRTSKPVNNRYILVYLGKYNLVTFGPEVQDRDVSEIYVHPDYNHTVFYNDIAVLKLTRPVDITNFVRPACLWSEGTDLENIIDKQGIVVGWGFDEQRKLTNNLMQAQMPVVSTVKCIYSNREFFSQFTFEKNYCAGFRNGTNVCNGDSGGGMLFPKKGTSGQNTVWQIRGIVSVGVALQGQGVCDPSHYIVFTDVAKHLDWLNRIMTY